MVNWIQTKLIKQQRKYFKRKNPKNSSYKPESTLNAIIGYNLYGGYCIPKSSIHRPACQSVLHGEVYEPETIKEIIRKYQGGDIIHAGTFFGDFLPVLFDLIDENQILWAFEPNVESFRCAQITILLNDLKNVSIFNKGLGNKNENLNFVVADSQGRALGGGSHFTHENKSTFSSSVEVDRLDDLIPENRQISIIHLDVEGFEKEVLEGAMEIIHRDHPFLILEDNADINQTDWFQDKVISLGYKKVKELNNNKFFEC